MLHFKCKGRKHLRDLIISSVGLKIFIRLLGYNIHKRTSTKNGIEIYLLGRLSNTVTPTFPVFIQVNYFAGFTKVFPEGALKSWGTETGVEVPKEELSGWGMGMLDFLMLINFVSITWQSICIIVTKSVFLALLCCHSVPRIKSKAKANFRPSLNTVVRNSGVHFTC